MLWPHQTRELAQLAAGKRRASKGGTELNEGLWRSPLTVDVSLQEIRR